MIIWVWGGGSSNSRIFHSFGEVFITGDGLQDFTYIIYSALMAIELWRFFNVPHLLWQMISDTHNVVERLTVELSLSVFPDLPHGMRHMLRVLWGFFWLPLQCHPQIIHMILVGVFFTSFCLSYVYIVWCMRYNFRTMESKKCLHDDYMLHDVW